MLKMFETDGILPIFEFKIYNAYGLFNLSHILYQMRNKTLGLIITANVSVFSCIY